MAENNGLDITGLRSVLWEELSRLRKGETTAANVNAVSNATGKILSTVKLQLEYCKMTGKTPDLRQLLPETSA